MKTRDTPREQRPHSVYIAIDMPDDFGEKHHFKVPSPLAGQPLVQEMHDSEGMKAQALWAANVVAKTWHHETLDLESTDPAEVFEELHEEGYRLEYLVLMASLIVKEILSLATIGTEVRERLGFSGAQRGGNESRTSESPSDTSETPSLTTD